jgi:hypothetical protein
MTCHENPGLLRRMLRALGGTLKRGILGKSTHDYTKQFTGSDAYWDRVIAAQAGWSQKQQPQPGPDRFRSSRDVVVRAGPSIRDHAPCPPEPEYEPVHGWTKGQLGDYLARNPGYRLTYGAELQKHCYAAAPAVNGSSFNWFGLRRMNHDKAASNINPNGTK